MFLRTSLAILLIAVSQPLLAQKQISSFDHSAWNELLQKYVSSTGEVDYQGMKGDLLLGRYLGMLNRFAPSDGWSNDQKMAYWINAYNAYTVKLVADNLPLKSIRDIDDPWKKEFARIGGKTYSLDHIEHEILRKEFNDPRIHFAINCASFSCPILWNIAYTAERLNGQLERAASRFINDGQRNVITKSELKLSALFDWFKDDFTKYGTLSQYIQKYTSVAIDPDASISYLEYDWTLNSQ